MPTRNEPVRADPHALSARDLVLSHFSLARHHPIGARIGAAAAAGFAGIGLYLGDYQRQLEAGLTPDELDDMLSDAGVCLAEIEVLTGWADPSPLPETTRLESLAWEVADRFGCRYVQAIGPVGTDIATAAVGFGTLCDRAADHGLTVGLEFLPFTDVADLASARAIVETAGRLNGGVCLDIWHCVRSGCSIEEIAAIPPDLIAGLQMSDGTSEPAIEDYKSDCLAHRVPPGDGEFDLDGFVSTIVEAGVDAPWSVEVCNTDAWAADPDGHVGRSADGMRRVLDRVVASRHGVTRRRA